MKIAVTYDNNNGTIFQHFGHTPMFKVYEVDGTEIISAKVVSTGESGHGALAGVLNDLQADVLICGGIGAGAQTALTNAGIKFYGGVNGSADSAVISLLSGKLDYNPNVKCTHHHEGEHTCGEHSCK